MLIILNEKPLNSFASISSYFDVWKIVIILKVQIKIQTHLIFSLFLYLKLKINKLELCKFLKNNRIQV